jgi:transcriptional regulator with XRE-family HTH domain
VATGLRISSSGQESEVGGFVKTATLVELREICGMTQKQLARTMKVSQSMVPQIESRSDLRLSTLRNYIEALGGELEVFANIDDVDYRLRIGQERQK